MSISPERREAFLREMDIGPSWKRRNVQAMAADGAEHDGKVLPLQDTVAGALQDLQPEKGGATGAPSSTAPPASEIAAMPWESLKIAVSRCTRCNLCASRTHAVVGVGDEKAAWLFIGEGPGRNEDLKGEPFIGPAGKLLDNMLLAMDLRRKSNAYIANVVKCRPTGPDSRDRAPTPEEVAACLPYLQRQIAMIKPTVIVVLGKTAAISLLGLDQETPVGALRGKVHRYEGIPLIVTYHPAYLLRKPADKSKAWNDLCLAINVYDEERRPAG